MKDIQIVAQAGTAPAAAPASGTVDPPGWLNFVPIILLVLVMYVFMFRNQKGRDQKKNEMLAKMKKGDEVQTIGGEFGRVVDVRDDRVLLKVDETSNTKIWYSRSAIHRVVTDDKVEAK
ncbi:MAG TPA: preprotein translocase subunit YajC [Tepidisphaeraceae bacterium]|nr:preprotein translocase subunit YajC [Tepidisphaeraceae bacterium]